MGSSKPTRQQVDKAGSELYYFGVGKLFHESIDFLKELSDKEKGTIPGALIESCARIFASKNVKLAKDKSEESLSPSDLDNQTTSYRVFVVISEFLECLPESKKELVSIAFELCEDKDRDSILMMDIPNSISEKLKILSGGRWPLERLEADLWKLIESRR